MIQNQIWNIVIVGMIVCTFVCTKLLVINSKSNIGRFIGILENKFRLPPWSLLTIITVKSMNNNYTSVPKSNSHINVHKKQLSLPQYCLYWGHMSQNSLHPLSTSCCTLNRPGWCHSDLEFKMGTWLLLIRTASLTCLVRQSLVLAVTLALNMGSSPPCLLFWCFSIKESADPDW